MATPGISKLKSTQFCSTRMKIPATAPAATALRVAPMRDGRISHAKKSTAATATGRPHSAAHWTKRFSGWVQSWWPGLGR
ncbi:MAG: hypothetical protein CVU63_25175 [Deltaproteobacteria bacterium HGW-Deltaproteobacteria-20]|nr:MAG: hypothetical protein CVU63_25175 [Deltaproteobacteria bacterium HGW-Deltaproteobacteria-20]